MPVAQSQGHAGKALVIAAVAIVLIAVVTVFLALAASRGDVEINLGDERFEVGNAEDIIELIEEGDGLPVSSRISSAVTATSSCSTPATTRTRAGSPSAPSTPTIRPAWSRSTARPRTLVNACDPDVTYPAHGEGLRAYPTTVEDGTVIVDINELTHRPRPPRS